MKPWQPYFYTYIYRIGPLLNVLCLIGVAITFLCWRWLTSRKSSRGVIFFQAIISAIVQIPALLFFFWTFTVNWGGGNSPSFRAFNIIYLFAPAAISGLFWAAIYFKTVSAKRLGYGHSQPQDFGVSSCDSGDGTKAQPQIPAVTKRRMLLRFLTGVIAISAIVLILNYIGIGCYLYPSFQPHAPKQLRDTRAAQWPAHVTFKVTDQDGNPAPLFAFRVKLHTISWYYGLLPQIALKDRLFTVTTDNDGNGRLYLPFQKAFQMEIEQLPGGSYIFAPGRSVFKEGAEYIEDDPVHIPFSFKGVDPKAQLLKLRVLRHGPTVSLTTFAPTLTVAAADENLITLDMKGQKLLPGRQKGDVLITVRNAAHAIQFCRDTRKQGVPYREGGEWEVLLKAMGGTGIQQAENQYATFAPRSGYLATFRYKYITLSGMTYFNHEAVYKAAAPVEKATGFSLGFFPPPALSSDSGEEYHRLTHQLYFCRGFYLHNEPEQWYGTLSLRIAFDTQNDGNLTVTSSCNYNSNGSNNLWAEKMVVLWGYN